MNVQLICSNKCSNVVKCVCALLHTLLCVVLCNHTRNDPEVEILFILKLKYCYIYNYSSVVIVVVNLFYNEQKVAGLPI